MGTISNGESGLSVRNKLNDVIDKIEGTTDIGNNILFGDNSKAIFGGATSELQIYSDGTHSRISDQGTGNLIINAGEFRVNTANDAEAIIKGNTSGDVELYYAGGQKLATTSTGIDVTGTVTADGLTVNSGSTNTVATFQSTDAGAGINFTDNTGSSNIQTNGAELRIGVDEDAAVASSAIKFRVDGSTKATIDSSGNVMVGGTVAGNASTISLNVGNVGLTNGGLQLWGTTTGTHYIQFGDESGTAANHYRGYMAYAHNGDSLRFGTASAERMRIDSSGNVGINETSPATELDVNGTTTSNQYLLDNIAATISDTAVDIFVYDTRKDSDGGAWRKRTQGTSWYNETLNTSTRGSRKEFPAVAVIVAESTQVTIYDGDDPDLPMWMVFNRAGDSYFASSSTLCTSVVFFNGLLVFGVGTGTREISFLKDSALFRTNSGKNKLSQPISGRNSGNAGLGYDGDPLVNSAVNDVAMTVLPNAPIDAATGLPVPTIAVATDGGVSVIKDDGTVVDITSSSGFNGIQEIDFTDDNKLVYTMDSASNARAVRVDSIPAADFNVTSNQLVKGNGEEFYTGADFGYPAGDLNLNLPTANNVTKVVGSNLNDREIATTNGMTKIALANQSDPSTGMVAYTTSSYNTGWMNGDIKLATLSDTDATNVTGSELVTNGSMEANNSWEAVNTPTASGQTSAQAHSGTYSWYFTSDGNYDGIQSSVDFSITSGKAYVIDAWVYPVNDTGITLKFGGVNRTVTGLTQGAWNQVTETIVSTQTTVAGIIGFNTDITWGSGTWYIDDVSVRLAEEDRSVNGNGLQVFGTVTKSAVATGADLVAYSGFSTSNYLEQPYNSDLDYSGDFVVMGWFKGSGSGSVQTVFHRRTAFAANNIGLEIGFNTDNTFYFYTRDLSGETYTALANNAVATGLWTHFVCVRQGQRMTTFLNGSEYLTATGTVRDLTSSTAVCRIGGYISSSPVYPWQGDLALIRTSATAPSPEQIKKIYEDEKVLFQENAQVTLYGSSDAVTALAYDDTTELLHVGTSAGRSVFQGLRRVDNTTTAVGAAISASNGLVADE